MFDVNKRGEKREVDRWGKEGGVFVHVRMPMQIRVSLQFQRPCTIVDMAVISHLAASPLHFTSQVGTSSNIP